MKTEIKKKERQPIGEKPMKRLSLNILFREVADLADLFTKVHNDILIGTDRRSMSDKKTITDFRVEYSQNHQYTERVINGQVCWVYKSKA